MVTKKKKTLLYNIEYDETMFRSEANKVGWIVLLSVIYFIILGLVLIQHFTAENVNTNVTKYTMPIFISVITIAWIVLCAFLIHKRTIIIDESGFSFKRLKKTINYLWTDVKDIDINKSKNYIVVEFNNGKTYGTGYIKEIENLIIKYYPK